MSFFCLARDNAIFIGDEMECVGLFSELTRKATKYSVKIMQLLDGVGHRAPKTVYLNAPWHNSSPGISHMAHLS
ncbi:hypothetical protein GDO78_002963 [Eleutherodactylus coqui]|uniref:Uncharacterized protein n=1 Tax=Eleutherodactylus coqui TaxID=57060 RepID=A0A8J6EW55_ELECQ|nr:hypothetical protein GDO78_002963 [Eleutherodactylus coqui]